MTKKDSLVLRVIMMVCMTAFIICIAVTGVGSYMIYLANELGAKNEVQYAAHTLYNLYNDNFHGEYYYDNGLKKGSADLTEEDFNEIVRNIGQSGDMDFTIFWESTRMLTTLQDENGNLAVGTKASEEVVEQVLNNGLEYYFSDVSVNEVKYVGCYIPIMNSSAQAVGMVFAGKPLASAARTTNAMTVIFALICGAILVVALIVTFLYSRKMVVALGDIKGYMMNIADCNFDSEMKDFTVKRLDEIGDIARSAQKLCSQLQGLIERDPLTGLLNRRTSSKKMDEMVKSSKIFSVVMTDIDFFKKVNDTYGHAAGDAVLTGVASILLAEVRKNNGFAFRWGGEEFLLVLPEKNLAQTKSILDGLIEQIRAQEIHFEDKTIKVTMTFGGVQRDSHETYEQAINRADELLYNGKQSGRNRIIMEQQK
ncbi:MAG: diguanylate cyclase [Oscillospiraceae bacterium]|nr:diguanylate cyclase [Oscillospiraceae bacterium]